VSGGLPTEYPLVYTGVRQITDSIFIWCMDRSGGLPTKYPLVYTGVRQITDSIFIRCMDRSGGLPTKYSFGVWLGQADDQPNIHWMYDWVSVMDP
jgi:hypothetical protein